MPDSRARLMRYFWGLLFAFATSVVILATAYSLRTAYTYYPAFLDLGLDFSVVDGKALISTVPRSKAEPAIPADATIVAIDGKAIAADSTIDQVADRLMGAPGPVVSVTLQRPDGSTVQLQQERRPFKMTAEHRAALDLQMVTRLGFALFACTVLLVCSLLLALRRPADPVAMLFAIIFALMAASVYPALQMWMWTGLGVVEDLLANSWFYLLLVTLCVFPDGVFVPRFLRWMVIGALPLVVFATLPAIDGTIQVLVAAAALLALLTGQVIRFKRLPPGIERQQIKWAAFGFAAGFVVLAISFIMVAFIPNVPEQQNALFSLVTLSLFSIGIALIPLGLLIALTRFRLWEADTVISRSAAYAVVTLIVGVVWAASSDLVKLVITEVMGRESEAGATTVGAIIAAGVFAPTQSAILGWTRKHFGGPMDRIKGAAERLKSWGLTETPAELAKRALAIVDEAVHPLCAAIVIEGAGGTEVVGLRDARSAADPRLIERIELADEEGPVGTLRLGRRSDGNRYNRQELEAVRELGPHIADAMRVALGRHGREAVMQQQLEAMAARLAQLEGGMPKPA